MEKFVVSQMHIEAARNSTDDFNLFHDKHRWHLVKDNPFGGPIALGFQLACFSESSVSKARSELELDQRALIDSLTYRHYEFTYAGVVRPGDELSAIVRKGKASHQENNPQYSNRLAVKANGKTVMLGVVKDCNEDLLAVDFKLPSTMSLKSSMDRSFIEGSDVFLKRKYMIVGNAKNFLCSAFVEQSYFIDEFIDKVKFPQSYPLSLISSALLERAQVIGHDLISDPMIYVSQKLCVNKPIQQKLHSSDQLSILITQPEQKNGDIYTVYDCIGVLNNQDVLYRAQLQLLPLRELIDKQCKTLKT